MNILLVFTTVSGKCRISLQVHCLEWGAVCTMMNYVGIFECHRSFGRVKSSLSDTLHMIQHYRVILAATLSSCLCLANCISGLGINVHCCTVYPERGLLAFHPVRLSATQL
jgi:hypothetical protein